MPADKAGVKVKNNKNDHFINLVRQKLSVRGYTVNGNSCPPVEYKEILGEIVVDHSAGTDGFKLHEGEGTYCGPFLEMSSERMALDIEKLMWCGDTESDDPFLSCCGDGFLKVAASSSCASRNVKPEQGCKVFCSPGAAKKESSIDTVYVPCLNEQHGAVLAIPSDLCVFVDQAWFEHVISYEDDTPVATTVTIKVKVAFGTDGNVMRLGL